MLLTVCVLWKHKYVFIKLCLSQEECAWYHLNIKLTGAVSHTPTPDQEGMEMFDLLISQEQRLCCEVWCRHTFPQLSHYKRISCKSVINIFYPVTYIYLLLSLCSDLIHSVQENWKRLQKKRRIRKLFPCCLCGSQQEVSQLSQRKALCECSTGPEMKKPRKSSGVCLQWPTHTASNEAPSWNTVFSSLHTAPATQPNKLSVERIPHITLF